MPAFRWCLNMKRKTSLIALCSCIILGVFLLLCLDGLTKSPDLNDIDDLTVIHKNYTLKIDDQDMLRDFIKLGSSLKEVRKLDSYNINDFFTLSYTQDGKKNSISISSKYFMKDGVLYGGSKLSKLYKLVDNYIIANEPVENYLTDKTFYVSMMDMPLEDTVSASDEVIHAIRSGSINTDMYSKYKNDRDILSTIYRLQEFPAYKIHGSSLIDSDTVDIYVINRNLVYLDSNDGSGKFIDIPCDLYTLINPISPETKLASSSIYYLFNATSLKYKGKDIKLKDGAIRALCGLYPIDVKDSKSPSDITLEAVLDGKPIEISLTGSCVEFNNKRFESPTALESFNRIIRSDD